MTDLESVLEQAELRYVSTDQPGYTRKRWGRGFTYRDHKGSTLRDEKTRLWIESLAIPPAWEEVWICRHKNGHILVTGRDDRGRKQYIYHPRWHEVRQENRFNALAGFAQHLPGIRETTDKHMRQRSLNREKVLAVVVSLLEETLIRIGNKEYARDNESYGITTLQDDHVSFEGSRMCFEFLGKSGKEQIVNLKDRRLTRLVKECQEIPGYHLFQYYDEDGTPYPIGSSDVNDYLYETTGERYTAKIFRTWGASSYALSVLGEMPPVGTKKEREAQIRDAVKQVADKLGNTPTVCRTYYIHPYIFDAHMEGELQDLLAQQKPPTSRYALNEEEKALVQLILERVEE
jgi:DNA topoisomerase I